MTSPSFSMCADGTAMAGCGAAQRSHLEKLVLIAPITILGLNIFWLKFQAGVSLLLSAEAKLGNVNRYVRGGGGGGGGVVWWS